MKVFQFIKEFIFCFTILLFANFTKEYKNFIRAILFTNLGPSNRSLNVSYVVTNTAFFQNELLSRYP